MVNQGCKWFYLSVQTLQQIKKFTPITFNWDLIVKSVIPQDICVYYVDYIKFGPYLPTDEMSLCFTALLIGVFLFVCF